MSVEYVGHREPVQQSLYVSRRKVLEAEPCPVMPETRNEINLGANTCFWPSFLANKLRPARCMM